MERRDYRWSYHDCDIACGIGHFDFPGGYPDSGNHTQLCAQDHNGGAAFVGTRILDAGKADGLRAWPVHDHPIAGSIAMEELSAQLTAVVLTSFRIAPVFGFAPPFTLLRVPAAIRLLMGFGIAVWLVGTWPQFTVERIGSGSNLLGFALGELVVGLTFTMALQLAFAAILWAGQALDIQAGFGLAMIADPTTQAQMPLAGTVFAYAGAAIFFATGAQYDLLALWAVSLETMPIGYHLVAPDMAALGTMIGALFAIGLGLVAVTMLTLFLLDLVIAFMSRTLPQMNVLLFGFQIKSMAMLLTLPIALAMSASLFLRMIHLALSSAPGLLTVH